MSKHLFFKFFAIGVVSVFLLIALGMVNGLVHERMAKREEALRSIADGLAGNQTLIGPVWVLPYRQLVQNTGEDAAKRPAYWKDGEFELLPEKLVINGHLQSFVRHRDIYQALLYHTSLHISGTFAMPNNANLPANSVVEWGQPRLSLGISDTRGIMQNPTVQWNNANIAFQPGANFKAADHGVNAPLPGYSGRAENASFSLTLVLDGMDQFGVIPLGKDTEMSLSSDWASPSFVGDYLPTSHAINAKGFSAQWHTTWFSTNMNDLFAHCTPGACPTLDSAAMSVRLIDPVDVYAQTDRAVKYGFLFIMLTIGIFFFAEVIRRIAIHPVQYAMVGLSLAIFFLLLLSLAEQMPFWVAYLLAATACILQSAFYARHAMGGVKQGVLYALLLSVLYGMLYLLLCLETYALLCGSILLFAALTAAMVLTRKLNWYGVGTELDGSSQRT